MIYDKNNVLPDDELVIVSDLLKTSKKNVYTYKINILTDLSCFIFFIL